jgi:hypothetical protein
LIVNIGIANKNAAALAADLDPEQYCLALISGDLNLGSLPPAIQAKQRQTCAKVLEDKKK